MHPAGQDPCACPSDRLSIAWHIQNSQTKESWEHFMSEVISGVSASQTVLKLLKTARAFT